jgi:hypothetical protein
MTQSLEKLQLQIVQIDMQIYLLDDTGLHTTRKPKIAIIGTAELKDYVELPLEIKAGHLPVQYCETGAGKDAVDGCARRAPGRYLLGRDNMAVLVAPEHLERRTILFFAYTNCANRAASGCFVLTPAAYRKASQLEVFLE